MEIGCHLPGYGPAATRESALGFARRMETLGLDSLWVSDHAGRRLARGVPVGRRAGGRAAPAARGLPRGGRDFEKLTLSIRVGLPGRKPAAELVSELRGLRDLGVSHVVLESRVRDFGEMVTTYQRFAEDVRSAVLGGPA